jgi:GNAT superfamily N-acetyltransferase
MEYTIREARKSDMQHVLNLVRELAHFEKEPHAVEVSVQDLERDGFGRHKLFQCFVAETEYGIGGMALVYPRYSTWKGPVIHLEDLIVTEELRGSGLGSALFETVIRYGHEQGVRRISWEVLDWNEPAIKFYESKGARVMRDWNVVQLDEKAIQQFINKI